MKQRERLDRLNGNVMYHTLRALTLLTSFGWGCSK